ncbi:copper amine oxidase N-terminal domain-containing protein [Anaerobacillus sp. MEB173]|uniref:copper amine oxidase N-terminal domain-containing protein n=1 Tax=Anaerobacillus sp. MEB173 TaxID=3383345 RepID=UPI003F9386B0
MKKYSVLALFVALAMVITACTSPAGLLLKEATMKQLELDSFEAKSTISVDIDTAEMEDSFVLEAYTKQVDMLNSVVDFYVEGDLLSLAGLEVQPNEDGKVSLQIISKDGNSILASKEDDIGLQLADLSMMEEELGEGEFEQFIVTIQDAVREFVKAYVDDYGYTLNDIVNHGQVTIQLPNGQSVNTNHIEVSLSVVEVIEMLQYSLNHFIENDELQETFYSTFLGLPLMMGDTASEDAQLSEEELQEMLESIQAEGNAALKGFVDSLEEMKQEFLLENEELLNDLVTISYHTYIGVNDKQTYQTELSLQINYTEELADQEIEELQSLPFAPGDSIKLTSKDQYWNHNKQLDPITVPSQLVTMEELMENIDEFKAMAGENSLLAQIAELLTSAGNFGFIELKINENKAETMTGEVDAHLYIKNGQTMAPLALVSESIGADVVWLADTRQIIVAGNGHFLEVQLSGLNKHTVTFDGEVRSDIFVEVINGTSYVNVRAYAEAMGWTLLWIPETKSVVILP